MNKFFKILGIITLIASIGFSITACGRGNGGNPKAIGKQRFELLKEGMKLYDAGTPGESVAEKFGKKREALAVKYDELSSADKRIADAEFDRLSKEWQQKKK